MNESSSNPVPSGERSWSAPSGDFLARDRRIQNVMPGDLLAVCTAGAYGMVLASNYNSRPRPAEVMIEGPAWRTVRQRETWEDLVRGE